MNNLKNLKEAVNALEKAGTYEIPKDLIFSQHGEYTISHKLILGSSAQHHGSIVVEAHDKSGEKVGHVNAEAYGKPDYQVQWSEVHPNHRRKGLAYAMYNHIEKVTDRKLTHGDISGTPETLALWKKRESR